METPSAPKEDCTVAAWLTGGAATAPRFRCIAAQAAVLMYALQRQLGLQHADFTASTCYIVAEQAALLRVEAPLDVLVPNCGMRLAMTRATASASAQRQRDLLVDASSVQIASLAAAAGTCTFKRLSKLLQRAQAAAADVPWHVLDMAIFFASCAATVMRRLHDECTAELLEVCVSALERATQCAAPFVPRCVDLDVSVSLPALAEDFVRQLACEAYRAASLEDMDVALRAVHLPACARPITRSVDHEEDVDAATPLAQCARMMNACVKHSISPHFLFCKSSAKGVTVEVPTRHTMRCFVKCMPCSRTSDSEMSTKVMAIVLQTAHALWALQRYHNGVMYGAALECKSVLCAATARQQLVYVLTSEVSALTTVYVQNEGVTAFVMPCDTWTRGSSVCRAAILRTRQQLLERVSRIPCESKRSLAQLGLSLYDSVPFCASDLGALFVDAVIVSANAAVVEVFVYLLRALASFVAAPTVHDLCVSLRHLDTVPNGSILHAFLAAFGCTSAYDDVPVASVCAALPKGETLKE